MNVDFENPWSKKKPDLECDIRKLPYGNDSVDEILAVHVIEHFHLWEAPAIIAEWHRVLKPGGKMVLECPCLNKVLFFLAQKELVLTHTLFALYGDPQYCDPAMVHKWCYSKEHLSAIVSRIFGNATVEAAQYHRPERDMRVVGIK